METTSKKRALRTQKIVWWWRWWDEAEHKSTPEKRLAFYDALMRYIFCGEQPGDPLTMENPTGCDFAAYDATHYFDVVDSLVEHTPERNRGGQPKNQNARKRAEMAEIYGEIETQYTETQGVKTNRQNEKTNRKTNGENEKTNDCKTNNEYENEKNESLRMKNEEYIKRSEERYTPHTPQGGNACVDGFAAFWKAYPKECPRKVDKVKCKAKFERLCKEATDPAAFLEELLTGLERWKRSETWRKDDGAFICAPLVWLNNERWRDEPKAAEGVLAPTQPKQIREKDWELCAEVCANCRDGGGCAAGVGVPPPMQDWPMHPRQCKQYRPIGD